MNVIQKRKREGEKKKKKAVNDERLRHIIKMQPKKDPKLKKFTSFRFQIYSPSIPLLDCVVVSFFNRFFVLFRFNSPLMKYSK